MFSGSAKHRSHIGGGKHRATRAATGLLGNGYGKQDEQGERERDEDGRVGQRARRAAVRVGEGQPKGIEWKRGSHGDEAQVPVAGELPADATLTCQRMHEQPHLVHH